MTTGKKAGIWMDHSNANLIELSGNETKTIESAFSHAEKESGSNKNENLMHHKEQQQQSAYYKKIGDTIKNYDEVLLFGPTTAKSELANLIKADHHFDAIKVTVKDAGKMTDNQLHAFVKDHFFKAIA